ncbi:hypothetical protein ADUPG1_009314 [Aduncisulcus paluster]|uniref:Uncharacterized protein n=1 Tax=Aduncisulcus paluster TaxID=2918883 RepID=A0ABQ5KV48_9EUKA|nr:hypothetical protein ADUPG1_009314 [Aduncisulcus paluster]
MAPIVVKAKGGHRRDSLTESGIYVSWDIHEPLTQDKRFEIGRISFSPDCEIAKPLSSTTSASTGSILHIGTITRSMHSFVPTMTHISSTRGPDCDVFS